MKTTSEIYCQFQRIWKVFCENKKREIKKADPDTGGNEMLCHNWGNENAKQKMDEYNLRMSRYKLIYANVYFKAFKREHPEHNCSKSNQNPFM